MAKKKMTAPIFWMVFRPGSRGPAVQHENFHKANDEARRLAEQHMGETVYVLQAVKGIAKQPPSPPSIKVLVID